jgi:lipid-binding SYLF domain-containing protein
MTKKVILLTMVLATTLPLFAQDKASTRLSESTAVLKTILTEQGIPKGLLGKAVCVLVYPSVRKVGVGIGVTYGRGIITCRKGAEMNGKWSAPATGKHLHRLRPAGSNPEGCKQNPIRQTEAGRGCICRRGSIRGESGRIQ